MDLEDHVAIVTGGASGIGAACVDALAADGARVTVADIQDEAGRAKADEHGAGRALFAHTDVSRAADAERCVEATVETFGRLDILVNNAGTFVYKPLHEYSEAEWDLVLDVNLKGMFLLGKFAIPHLRAAGGGSIVNMASVHAQATTANLTSYAASKAGILGLTRAMALDYGPDGIRVNAIVPGAIDTPLSRRNAVEAGIAEADIEASWAPIHALGHHGQPADVAHMVVFLCTDKARFITGSAFAVDGGLLARA